MMPMLHLFRADTFKLIAGTQTNFKNPFSRLDWQSGLDEEYSLDIQSRLDWYSGLDKESSHDNQSRLDW